MVKVYLALVNLLDKGKYQFDSRNYDVAEVIFRNQQAVVTCSTFNNGYLNRTILHLNRGNSHEIYYRLFGNIYRIFYALENA